MSAKDFIQFVLQVRNKVLHNFFGVICSSLVSTGNQELESIIERGHISIFSDDEGNLDENTSSDKSVGYVQLLSMFQFMILIVKGKVV